MPTSPAEVSDLSERVANALRRRMYPYTNLRLKQIPVGDREALVRWSKGQSAPSTENFAELIRFFWHMGDKGFLWEVLGIEPIPTCATTLANEMASDIAAALKRMGGGRLIGFPTHR